MENEILTVVIPVYNGEKHISRALECLKNQTWKHFKVLIINDGSKDGTLRVIEKYKNDINLSVKNLEQNHGVSFCRSLGIKTCETQYITFMDHDDWIDVDTYSQCFATIKDDADVVIFGLNYEYIDINVSENKYVYNTAFSLTGDYAIKIYGHTIKDNFKITPIVNNKIYKHEFLKNNDIKFDSEIRYQEDDIFTFKILIYAKKIMFIPKCKYHYLQNSSSAIHQVSEFTVNQFIKAYSTLKQFLETKNIFQTYKNEFYLKFKSSLKGAIYRIVHYGTNPDTIRHLISILHNGIIEFIDIEEYLIYCDLNRI